MDSSLFLDSLLSFYKTYYDIEKNVCINGIFIDAFAQFHDRNEKYMLSPNAKLWGCETNDYAYFLCADFKTADELRKVRSAIISDGLSRIKPHSEHMFSDVTMVLISQNISDEIKKEIKKFRYTKTYRFNFYGRMYFKAAAVCLADESIVHCPRGRELKQPLENALKFRAKEAAK